jgi:tRNA pseudouridine38-40 synthase
MRNFRLVFSYDGTNFSGWQNQPNRRTIQNTLESAIAELTGEAQVRVNASGRTDAGVHAVAQVANVHSATRLAPEVLLRAINARMPEDLILAEVSVVADDFDANRDAVRKLYRYVIHDGDFPDLFMRRYSYHCRYRLDASRMARAARWLLGTHDFRCFETEWPNRASSVRTITHVSVNRFGDWIWVDVEADGFLYNMVRAITGTLVNIGRGYWPEEYLTELIANGDRASAGPTVPAAGLFLMRVTYDNSESASENSLIPTDEQGDGSQRYPSP